MAGQGRWPPLDHPGFPRIEAHWWGVDICRLELGSVRRLEAGPPPFEVRPGHREGSGRVGQGASLNPAPQLLLHLQVNQLTTCSTDAANARGAERSTLTHTPKSGTTLTPIRSADSASQIKRPSKTLRLPSGCSCPKSGIIHSSGVSRRAFHLEASSRARLVLPAEGRPTITNILGTPPMPDSVERRAATSSSFEVTENGKCDAPVQPGVPRPG